MTHNTDTDTRDLGVDVSASTEDSGDPNDEPVPTEDDGSEEEEDTSHLSTGYVTLVRVAFPLVGLTIAVLYIESTYGRIRLSNLYYPYFVIGMLGVFSLSIFINEARELTGRSPDYSFVESVRSRAIKWNRSIGLVTIGAVYVGIIEIVGFFPASFVAMIAIMALGGLRDPKTMVGVTLLVLTLVYLLFIRLMGLRPPEGVIGL